MWLTRVLTAKHLLFQVSLQNWLSKPFINVNTPDDQNWRDIFSLLREELEPEISGRAGVPEELRGELVRMAQGKLNEAAIKKLCEKIVNAPESLVTLAHLLENSGVGAWPGEPS